MQYQKMCSDQRESRDWNAKRNRLVGEILAKNPSMPSREGLRMANKILHKAKATKKSSKGGYAARNTNLKKLGFDNYKEYLKSEDWVAIRARVFESHPGCCMCQNKAEQIHHFSYETEVLAGLFMDLLFPVCDACHKLVEFDGDKKRTLAQAQQNLIAWFAINNESMANRIVSSVNEIKQLHVSEEKKPKKKRKW